MAAFVWAGRRGEARRPNGTTRSPLCCCVDNNFQRKLHQPLRRATVTSGHSNKFTISSGQRARSGHSASPFVWRPPYDGRQQAAFHQLRLLARPAQPRLAMIVSAPPSAIVTSLLRGSFLAELDATGLAMLRTLIQFDAHVDGKR
jgi:hypothetical protein